MEKNSNKKFFEIDNYNKLLEKATDDFDLDIIKEASAAFSEYVKVVDDTETAIKISYLRLEGYDLRTSIENLDRTRKFAHNSAIVSVKMLNKLAASYEIANIFIGDLDDRLEVADFCLEFVTEIFNGRRI